MSARLSIEAVAAVVDPIWSAVSIAVASGDFAPLVAEYWRNPWVHYGICITWVPLLIACIVGLFLEVISRQWWCESFLITYVGKQSRRQAVAETQSKISFARQFCRTLWTFFGPLSLGPLIIYRYSMTWRHGTTSDAVVFDSLPSLQMFLYEFVLSALIADFGLYWGHRLQHDILFLWDKCHWEHHQLKNPTAYSVAFIDSGDATLQAILPLSITGMLLGTHPFTMMCYHAFHLSNNFLNHSGVDAWWLNIITLKFLPFRSDNTFHDYHHHFSNRGGGSKNFAEMFWIWDYIFGTYCDTNTVTTHNKKMHYHHFLGLPRVPRA